MSAVTGVAGWVAAGIAAAMLAIGRRVLEERMEAVARACHELRGPLAAARLGLTFGARGDELPPGRLRAIDAELGRAALALEDLAGSRRAGARRRGVSLREVRQVDVGALTRDSVEAWQGRAEAAGVGLGAGPMDAGAVVWGDRLRLAQAVGNLLANAIEHGRGGVEVRVAVRAPLVRVEVRDEGPGLPAPVAELTRGARGGRGRRGRGLAIAAEVGEAHAGRLSAAPSDVGARLVLELPLAP